MATQIALSHINTETERKRKEIREQIVARLSDKEYRDIFVSEQINTGLAFQIRAMREQRRWTQSELGEKAGMAQSRISIMEDANYSRFSLNTLKRLASAFDVALIVRFEPYSNLVDHFVTLDSSSLNVASFENDTFPIERSLSDNLAVMNVGVSLVGEFEITEQNPVYMFQGVAALAPFSMNVIKAEPFPVATATMFYPMHEVKLLDVKNLDVPLRARAEAERIAPN